MYEEKEDFIVSELLSELKAENERKERLIRRLIRVIVCCVASILISFGGFIWYLNQYDFSGSAETTETITATGVYTLVDSEGNVIAQDISPEELENFMEVLYGENGTDYYDPQNEDPN